MGLLDEAIREHLELKRRGGADPTEVAREEHEALAPVFPDEHAAAESDEAELSREALDLLPPTAALRLDGESAGETPGDLSTVGQDTAELDMQTAMEEDPEPPAIVSSGWPASDGQPRFGVVAGESDDGPLEWTAAHEADRPPQQDMTGQ